MPTIELAQFIGPVGGLLCIAWAMGAISGYVFHSKTILKAHEQICEAKLKVLEDENKTLANRIAVLEARYESHGIGRIKLLKGGDIIDVGPGEGGQ